MQVAKKQSEEGIKPIQILTNFIKARSNLCLIFVRLLFWSTLVQQDALVSSKIHTG